MEKFETKPERPVEISERYEAVLWDLIKENKKDKLLIKIANTLSEARECKIRK